MKNSVEIIINIIDNSNTISIIDYETKTVRRYSYGDLDFVTKIMNINFSNIKKELYGSNLYIYLED